MLTSRERVNLALNHQEPDRVPLDLGASPVSGMHVSVVYALRQALGLDTRQVCRKAYHLPVQKFLSRVHPRLRFERNYEVLRPYAPYCEEIIILEE